jgi:hypothetical protein
MPQSYRQYVVGSWQFLVEMLFVVHVDYQRHMPLFPEREGIFGVFCFYKNYLSLKIGSEALRFPE